MGSIKRFINSSGNEEMRYDDNCILAFGDSEDVQVKWDGTNLVILPVAADTGAINIGNGTLDIDVKIFLGSTTEYVLFDVGNSLVDFGVSGTGIDVRFFGDTAGKTMVWDCSADALTIDGSLLPITSDNLTLGSATKMIADAFLAAGAVLNFNNGDTTLTHDDSDNQGKLRMDATLDAGAMDDGYGVWEVNLNMTGSWTGHAAAASAWVNIPTGVSVVAGNYICARNDGVYEDSGATITNAKIIFGARMHKILGDTDALSFPHSINTNNTAITALYDTPNLTDMGMVGNAGTALNFLVPLMRDAGGTVKYVKLYDLQ